MPDANPYLVLASVLAGVLHGLERRGDPGPPVTGSAYHDAAATADGQPAEAAGDLPGTWEQAIEAFRAGTVLPSYLGERFCRLFAAVRAAERNRFHGRITPAEVAWYLTTV